MVSCVIVMGKPFSLRRWRNPDGFLGLGASQVAVYMSLSCLRLMSLGWYNQRRNILCCCFQLQSEVKQQQESMNEMYQTSVDFKRDLALAEARLKANEDARRSNETEKEDLKNKLESLRQQVCAKYFYLSLS